MVFYSSTINTFLFLGDTERKNKGYGYNGKSFEYVFEWYIFLLLQKTCDSRKK